MAKAHFAPGVRGHLITPLREKLGLKLAEDPAFDEFEGELEQHVRKFQKDHSKTEDGLVDEDLYKEILGPGSAFPTFVERAVMLIARFEDHGFFKNIRGNDDGACGTAGIIGFTVKFGPLLKVLVDIPEPDRQKALHANGLDEHADTLKKLLDLADVEGKKATKDRKTLAKALFFKPGSPTMIPAWEKFFRQVLKPPAVWEIQKQHADTDFFTPAEKAAVKGKTDSEYAKLLAFSTFVNSGPSFNPPAPDGTNTDAQRRLIAILRRSPETGENQPAYEARHVALAKGRGFPFINLTKWGFLDPDPAPPSARRILALPLSSSAQLKQVAAFETAAIASGAVSAAVPSPDLTTLWTDGAQTKSQERIAALLKLSPLDDLPLDCLVIGGEKAGYAFYSAAAGSIRLNATKPMPGQDRTLHWRAPNNRSLKFPFNPNMPGGLVILYAPSAVGPDDCFGRRLQQILVDLDGKAPLILGWFGPSRFPDEKGPNPAKTFFDEIKTALTPAAPGLRDLITADPERLIQAWGHGCHEAFANVEKLKGLWRKPSNIRQPKKVDDTTTLIKVDSACAAIHPDGTYWRAVETPANGIFMERSLI